MAAPKRTDTKGGMDRDKRTRRERPFPGFTLDESLAIARSIAEDNACKPYSRLSLAEAVDRSPESSAFRQLITVSAAYGLTEGSYQAPQIKLTELGLSVVAPKTDEEKRAALVRAAMNIELFKKLYEHFDQHKIPPQDNLKNTLIRDYTLDASLVKECIEKFMADGRFVGLIRQVAGAPRVSIHDAAGTFPGALEPKQEDLELTTKEPSQEPRGAEQAKTVPVPAPANPRVFITHGKNSQILAQLKDLLTFGKFVPVVAEEHETTSKPVPDKVLEDMRSCSAGIIHVAGEDELLDRQGNVHHKINENVLIEIGAGMALYGRNFILLVQRGIHLPSNLQGLYRCEYEGEKLDYDATMKLLKAFSGFR